jgi:PmbA protein
VTSAVAARGLEIAERACRLVEGDEADAFVHGERSGFARFAGSVVHQPTLIEDESVTIRVVRDGKVGTAATNRTNEEGLRDTARRAAEAADNARRDAAFPGLARPEQPPRVEGFDEETASLTPEEQAERAWDAIEAAPGHALYGYFTSGVTQLAVASTTGLAVSQAMTDATLLALAATDAESGYAEATSWKAGDLEPAAVAREAAEKAVRTRGAEETEPGTYRAVLEPYALADLVWYFALTSVGALPFLEGRSVLSDRIGERLFDPRFTLVDDGRDPRGLPKAFDFEGVAKQPVTIVDAGTVRDVVWDRRTAMRAGRTSTGHALAAPSQAYGPLAFNLAVSPGHANADELVEAVGDGIYVTRLHYVNVVDPREGIITGTTRDGTFRVENGRITRPLVNLRFTTSFSALAERLVGIGRDVKLVNESDFYDQRYPYATLVPALATEKFTIVGTGAAPGL